MEWLWSVKKNYVICINIGIKVVDWNGSADIRVANIEKDKT